MINQPEKQTQELRPQGDRLVLPSYSDGASQLPGGTLPQIAVPIRPEQLIRHSSPPPPQQPLARLSYFWRKDPAYKVLMIAVAFVLVAGSICISLAGISLLHNPNLFTLNSMSTASAPAGVGPTGTVDLRPTFAPPGGGQGTGTSSLPPAQGTPILSLTPGDTPTDQPSPTPGGALSVQITYIPGHVVNNSLVNVGVNTSEPNVTVTLVVVYNAAPFRDFAGPTVTDGSGNGGIGWMVSVYKTGGARAVVFVVAKDASGQRAQSQPVSVEISGSGG